MNLNGEEQTTPFEEIFDYVIVGSGAAGAAAARVLADTGASIAIVEEGPAVHSAEFSNQSRASARIFRDMGFQTTKGRSMIPVVQGSCLGGTTVINSAIVRRMPEDVWETWDCDYGLGGALPMEALNRLWDQIEEELSVQPTSPAISGKNNDLLKVAIERLGLSGTPTSRYESGCEGSALCSLGCPRGAKQSMLVSYLPYAEARGAFLVTCARVERILFKGNQAVGVSGFFHIPQFKRNLSPFTLLARKGVLVAASAIQTPMILANSGVRSQHLGYHFQGHPGLTVIGIFDDPVDMWSGATQGYETDHHRLTGRFKVESLAMPLELVLSRLPGVGRAWVQTIAEARHMAAWAVQLWAFAQGSVRRGLLGTDIRFELTQVDVRNLRRAIRTTAKMLFAAGASAVLPGIQGFTERLTSPDQLRTLEKATTDPSRYPLALTHLFGTARMSLRPSDGVVGTDFAVHGTKGCYVVDSSIFPTNLGMNPQHTIMAIAMHAAQQIASLA